MEAQYPNLTPSELEKIKLVDSQYVFKNEQVQNSQTTSPEKEILKPIKHPSFGNTSDTIESDPRNEDKDTFSLLKMKEPGKKNKLYPVFVRISEPLLSEPGSVKKEPDSNSVSIQKSEESSDSKLLVSKLSESKKSLLEFSQRYKPFKPKMMPDKMPQINDSCPICFFDMDHNVENVRTPCCDTTVHYLCMVDYLKNCVDDSQIPINCLFCEGELFEEFILNCFGTFEFCHYQLKYEKFSCKIGLNSNLEGIVLCPTPDCDFAFIEEPGLKDFVCEKCILRYCFFCMKKYHYDEPCGLVSQNTKLTQELIKNNQIKTCPRCKFKVERNGGCKNMICKCGCKFCYGCNAEQHHCPCNYEGDYDY